jgi:hypoxanthine phosphoribosyltransferase
MHLEPLIPSDAIQAKVCELAYLICAGQPENLLLVGVLKGSIHFLADLSRRLPCEVEIDFISVSSYATGRASSGIVQIRKDLDTNIEGRNVLIVEDIVDTGATLRHLRELLGTRKPRSLKVVSLLSKLQARGISSDIEYVGFEIPDEFVVGYGLDYGERYRNLPYIAILREG